MSDDEIDRMVREAEENAESDKQRKEQVELRNEADQLVFATDKAIKDLGDKVDPADVDKATTAKEALKTALEGTDLEAIRKAKDELQEIVQQLSMKVYEQMAQQAQAEGAEGQPGGSAKNDDNVVDADYTVVDEDDKKDNK